MADEHLIFICYSSEDGMIARAICAALEADHLRCWIAPRDISPSNDWAAEIIDGINGAALMVMVFSSRSNASPQVRREIERAVGKNIPVLPVRIENVLPSKSLEYFLSTQHWFDAFPGDPHTHLPRLVQQVRKVATRLAARAAGEETLHPTGSRTAGGDPARVAVPDGRATATMTSSVPLARGPGLTPQDVAEIEHQLTVYIGPIARVLVRRCVAAGHDREQAVRTLAQEIEQEQDRTAFLASARRPA